MADSLRLWRLLHDRYFVLLDKYDAIRTSAEEGEDFSQDDLEMVEFEISLVLHLIEKVEAEMEGDFIFEDEVEGDYG